MKTERTMLKIALRISVIVMVRAAKSPEEKPLKKSTGSFKSLSMRAASKSLSAFVSILMLAKYFASSPIIEEMLQKKTRTQI